MRPYPVWVCGPNPAINRDRDRDFHGLLRRVVWFGFDPLRPVIDDHFECSAAAELFRIDRYFHLAFGAGFEVHRAPGRKIEADEFNLSLLFCGNTQRETADYNRKSADRQPIEMIFRPRIHFVADAHTVAATLPRLSY